MEGFGETYGLPGLVYDDSCGKSNGNPTIGYGFDLTDKSQNTMGAVLNGLTFTVGNRAGNVFVVGAAAAQAAGNPILNVTNVKNYFGSSGLSVGENGVSIKRRGLFL